MASYHFTVKPVSFGKGQSAVATAAYNARTQLTNERAGSKTNDYSRASVAAFTGVFAPKDAPEWVRDREQLWNRAEAAERQWNGQPARNVEFSLPHELTDQQREWLVKDYVREAFVRQGMAADVAIHRPHKKSDERNHHVHILVTMRAVGADGLAATKTKEWNSRATLGEWREKLAILGARALERAGHKIEAQRFRHGHETLEKQRAAALARGDHEFAAGLDREPGRHVGPTATAMERKGIKTERGDINRAVQERNRERAGVEKELNQIERQITALESQDKTTFRDELGAAFAQQRDEKAMHSLGDALGGAAKTVGKVFEAVTRGGRTEPWMKGRGGVDGLNAAQRHSAALSYEKWKARKPELAGRHDFADYVQYVQEQWARGHYVESGDREIHRDAATVDRAADKLASTADRTVKKAMHGLSDALGGIGKVAERAMEMLSDLISPPPPMTHDQAERAERSAEEKHDEAAVADEAAAKEARLQELLAQIARDDAEKRRQREERGGRDDDDDRGRERERER